MHIHSQGIWGKAIESGAALSVVSRWKLTRATGLLLIPKIPIRTLCAMNGAWNGIKN